MVKAYTLFGKDAAIEFWKTSEPNIIVENDVLTRLEFYKEKGLNEIEDFLDNYKFSGKRQNCKKTWESIKNNPEMYCFFYGMTYYYSSNKYFEYNKKTSPYQLEKKYNYYYDTLTNLRQDVTNMAKNDTLLQCNIKQIFNSLDVSIEYFRLLKEDANKHKVNPIGVEGHKPDAKYHLVYSILFLTRCLKYPDEHAVELAKAINEYTIELAKDWDWWKDNRNDNEKQNLWGRKTLLTIKKHLKNEKKMTDFRNMEGITLFYPG